MTDELLRYEDGDGGIVLIRLVIKRRTAKGVWVDNLGVEKFVLNRSRKRYGYETEPEAFESYKLRKSWHISHLRAKLEKVEFIYDNLDRLRREALAQASSFPNQLLYFTR